MSKTAEQKAAEKAAKDAKKAADKAAKEAAKGGDARRAAVEKQLNDLGIPFEKSQSTENLEIIVHNHQNPGAQKPLQPKAGAVGNIEDEFEVGDPEALRPRQLPLVIKPKDGGEWKNPAQAEWARILNGYSYQNTKKWRKKKVGLLTTLKELGELSPEEAAERLLVLKGGDINITHGHEKLKDVK